MNIKQSKIDCNLFTNSCLSLGRTGTNNADDSLVTALYTDNSIDAAVTYFKKLQSQCKPIREEYFWPHITSQTDVSSILSVISIMRRDFGIKELSSKTIREFIVPALAKHLLPEDIMVVLQFDIGCKTHVAAASTVYHYLSVYIWSDALAIAKRYRIAYYSSLYKRVMIPALIVTKDVENFVEFLRIIIESKTLKKSLASDCEEDVVYDILFDLAEKINGENAELFSAVLVAIMSQGLCIQSNNRQQIQDVINAKMTTVDAERFSKMLRVLADGFLQPVPFDWNVKNLLSNEIAKIEELLETSPERLTTANYNTLLKSFYDSKDTEKFEQLASQLDANKQHRLENGIYYYWINLNLNNMDKVQQIYTRIINERPEYVLNWATAHTAAIYDLIKEDKIDEVIAFLMMHGRAEINNKEVSSLVKSLKWLAEHGRTNALQRVYDILLEHSGVQVTSKLMEPMVLVHLVNNDLKSAVETMHSLVTRYQIMPCGSQLMRELIRHDRVDELQGIVDLLKYQKGELNTLIDLSMVLVEGGLHSLAEDIVKTLGPLVTVEFIEQHCKNYTENKQYENMRDLFAISTGLGREQRSCIFDHMLQCYCNDNKIDEIIELWQKRIQEELPISNTFLTHLAMSLSIQRKNTEIPFDVPAAELDMFNEILEKIKSTKQVATVSMPSWNKVERLITNGKLDEAATMASSLIKNDDVHLKRVLNFLLQKLSRSGNINHLSRIERLLNDEQRKIYSIDNRKCVAYNKAGRGEEFLHILEFRLSKCKTETEIQLEGSRFPLVSHCLLESNPAVTSTCKSY